MEKYPHSLFLYNPENLLSEGCINIPRKICWEWKKARFGFQCLRTVVLWKENFPEVKQVKHVKLNFHHLALPCPSPSLSPIFESFPRTQVKHLWVPKCNTGMSQRNKRFLWNRKTSCCWKFQNKLNTITKNQSKYFFQSPHVLSSPKSPFHKVHAKLLKWFCIYLVWTISCFLILWLT